jgi:hypothetical protein
MCCVKQFNRVLPRPANLTMSFHTSESKKHPGTSLSFTLAAMSKLYSLRAPSSEELDAAELFIKQSFRTAVKVDVEIS